MIDNSSATVMLGLEGMAVLAVSDGDAKLVRDRSDPEHRVVPGGRIRLHLDRSQRDCLQLRAGNILLKTGDLFAVDVSLQEGRLVRSRHM